MSGIIALHSVSFCFYEVAVTLIGESLRNVGRMALSMKHLLLLHGIELQNSLSIRRKSQQKKKITTMQSAFLPN